MMWTNFLVLKLGILFTVIQQSQSTECPEVAHPRTRTFPSIVSYQSNKIPFDPRNSSLGNYVSFGFQTVDRLPKNSFMTFDSEHIIRLDLDGKSVRKIDEGAFLSLTCLKYLSMKNNSLKILTWKTFDGLGNLDTLELNWNKLNELPAMVFGTMKILSYLDLSNNNLKKFSPFTFSNSTNLKSLILAGNSLAYVDPQVLLPLINLEYLDLSFNTLTDLDAQKWSLPALKDLNLSGNFLRSYDTSMNYTFRSLRNMNLSSNRLTELNAYALVENFQNLTVIDLNDNFWYCDNLAKILHYLADSRVRIPTRNKTNINELGIDCDNDKTRLPYDFIDATTVAPSSSLATTTVSRYEENEVKIGSEIKKLSVKHNEILLEISGVRKLLIFSLLFFVVFVILYASFQIGLCDGLKLRANRREGYIDTTVQDRYSMLRT